MAKAQISELGRMAVSSWKPLNTRSLLKEIVTNLYNRQFIISPNISIAFIHDNVNFPEILTLPLVTSHVHEKVNSISPVRVLRDLSLPPRYTWDLRSSGMLRSVDWYLPMFRDILSYLSTTVKDRLALDDGAVCHYHSTLHIIPEGGISRPIFIVHELVFHRVVQ